MKVSTQEFLNKLEENFKKSLIFLKDSEKLAAINNLSMRETKLSKALGIKFDEKKLSNEQSLIIRISAIMDDLVQKLHTSLSSDISQIEDDCMYITSYFNLLLTNLQAKSIKPKNISKTEFIQNQLKINYENALNIAKAKNTDYASSSDPYKNFRLVETIGIKIYDGILVRLCDKISRINNLLTAEAMVKNESIFDTCLDAINYFTILQTYIQLDLSKENIKM